MEFKTEINTFLDLMEENGKVLPQQIMIVGKSGSGKGLFEERIAQMFKKSGAIVIVVADPKQEAEFGYAMFPPKEHYHLDLLRKIGTKIKTENVKLYHPFTFNIPNGFIPDINFYTFSLKDLTRREISFITETFSDSDTTKLLLSAIQNISDEDGILGLLHYLQDKIKGKRKGKHLIADPKNFFLSASMGTLKSLQDISNYFQLFKREYFLTKEKSPIKLDIKKILQDKDNYHVFLSNWIGDEKLRDFCILSIFTKIYENIRYAKYPVVIVIPEIRKLCPLRPDGYKIWISDTIKEYLSTMRSKGRGMSSILDTQTFEDVDEDVIDSCTEMFVGEMTGGRDVERICKAYSWGKDIKNQLLNMERKNCFFKVGKTDMGSVFGYLPSHMHKEPPYNFFEMYKAYYPNNLKRYDDLIKIMRKIYDAEEEKIRGMVKRKVKQEEIEIKQRIKEKEVKKDGKEDELFNKIKNKNKEITNLKKEQFFKDVEEHPEKSERKLAKDNGISRPTVKRWMEELNIQKEKENSKEVPEKIIGDMIMPEEIESE